jgi:alkylation response protein AidB-like acyl-CoA dehydrogenase
MDVVASASGPRDTETDWSGLAPSADTRDLVSAARAHFAALFPPARLRAMQDGGDVVSDDLWPLVVDYGYTAVGLPAASGGFGTIGDVVAVLEEAGRALATVPLMSTVSAAQTLLAAGEEVDDLAEVPRSVTVAGDGATDALVLDGGRVAEAIVLSAVDDGVAVRRYRLEPSPIERDQVDASRPLVRVPLAASELVGDRVVAGARLVDLLAPARVCVAADLVGVGQRALRGAVDHVLVREQFGRPIGSFQAVKHLLADAYVDLERARSLALGAASRLGSDTDPGVGTRLSLLAKAAASDAALRAAGLQVQLFGAMGLTFESEAPLALRRAQQTSRHLGVAADLYAAAAAHRLAGEVS